MMRWGGNGPAPELPRNVVVISLSLIAAGLFLAVVVLFYVLVTR